MCFLTPLTKAQPFDTLLLLLLPLAQYINPYQLQKEDKLGAR